MDRFYVGAHQPSDGRYLGPVFMSVRRLADRRSKFTVQPWIMDSGAFTELSLYGEYRTTAEAYAVQVNKWFRLGGMVAAVAQDYMCEPYMLRKTGLTVSDHQRLTLERYDDLWPRTNAYILPVVQGYAPQDYAAHAEAYGKRLQTHAYVGVGSVCKRNGDPDAVYSVLSAIREVRPGWRLHGFGLKRTALEDARVRRVLYTADSMAWSYAARREGRNANDWREALVYSARIGALIADDLLRPASAA